MEEHKLMNSDESFIAGLSPFGWIPANAAGDTCRRDKDKLPGFPVQSKISYKISTQSVNGSTPKKQLLALQHHVVSPSACNLSGLLTMAIAAVFLWQGPSAQNVPRLFRRTCHVTAGETTGRMACGFFLELGAVLKQPTPVNPLQQMACAAEAGSALW